MRDEFCKALGAGVDANRSAKLQGATSIDLRNYIESHVVHHNTERNKEPRVKMMRLSKRLAFFVAWSICSEGRAYPQHAEDRLQPLVETSTRRLALAEQVALAKWDSGAPVEDASREAQVIASATKAGESRGLDPVWVSNFFKAQIEANKLVQYSLLAEWRRLGKAPDHTPVSLAGEIRPALDKVEVVLIAELAEAAEIRASASCRADIAQAISKCVSAHKNSFSPLKAIALDRAMAATCT
jgi:chorismate mutase